MFEEQWTGTATKNPDYECVIIDQDGNHIAHVIDQTKARVMTAAPELLAVVKLLYQFIHIKDPDKKIPLQLVQMTIEVLERTGIELGGRE